MAVRLCETMFLVLLGGMPALARCCEEALLEAAVPDDDYVGVVLALCDTALPSLFSQTLRGGRQRWQSLHRWVGHTDTRRDSAKKHSHCAFLESR
ncbi:hypothetical protein Ddc_05113 [Ditylenchus destructor]|nr:hypothetical protein Ddc_05113 [Ditylenchus destructor]